MKAARMVKVGQRLEIQDIPAPTINPDDERDDLQVVLKVRACGICGTDLHQLKGSAKVARTPITLGHEIAGVVQEVGRAVASERLGLPVLKPGHRVVVNNVIWCGKCRPCIRQKFNFCRNALFLGRHIDGGLAEYIKVPARNLSHIPRNVSFEEGAVLACAVTSAYHALRVADVGAGDRVVVWGLGGVGLSLVQLARELSAAYPIIAVDLREETLRLASEMGADFAINASQHDPLEAILEITKGEGADTVFDAAGVKKTTKAGELVTLASVCPGGELIVIATYGSPVMVEPHDELGIFEKRFTGSCGNLPDELDYLIEIVAGRRRLDLSRLITHRIGLEEVNDILESWQECKECIIRPVVLF